MTKLFHFNAFTGVIAGLLAAAAFFRFAMHGYSYIAHTLVFITVVLLMRKLLPENLWRVAAALISAGLIFFCIVEMPILFNARTDSDATQKKYGVVLGAQVRGTVPSRSLNYRLYGAYEFLMTNPDSVVIVTGGQGEGEDITEAECMRTWLINAGIDESRIITEDKATSTMENLEYSFDIIRSLGDEPSGNVSILSSSYHLFRAKSMAARLGVDAAGFACVPGNPLLSMNYFIREAFGVTHLWVFGN